MGVKPKGICLDLQMYLQYGVTKVSQMDLFLAVENRFKIYQWLPAKVLKTVQARQDKYKFLCMEDAEYGSGKMFHRPVDDVGRYGKNVPIFYQAFQDQLSYFLPISQKKAMDIGSAWGLTLWKELLNGFNVTAVDLAVKKQDPLERMKTYVEVRVPKHLHSNLQIVADDILDVPSKYPQFKSSYDFINVQNVFHFYTPKTVDNVLKAMFWLLKDGGRAVITTETIKILGSEVISHIEGLKEAKAPYVIKTYEKGNDYRHDELLHSYTEDGGNFFHQDGERIEGTKVYFDMRSLASLCENNNFKVVGEYLSQDGGSISLVVEKSGELQEFTGEL